MSEGYLLSGYCIELLKGDNWIMDTMETPDAGHTPRLESGEVYREDRKVTDARGSNQTNKGRNRGNGQVVGR